MDTGDGGGFRYTLKELFAVVTVTGLALGIGCPALFRDHISSRSNTCRNNLRNLAIAAFEYEQLHRQLPGYVNTVAGQDRSWHFELLPFIEENDLYSHYNDPANSAANKQPTQTIELFLCPSTEWPEKRVHPPSSYVANTGLADSPPLAPEDPPADWPANGVFHDLRERYSNAASPETLLPRTTMTARYIADHDGTQHTILLAENADAASWALLPPGDLERQLGCLWQPIVAGKPPRPAPPFGARINEDVGGDPAFTSRAHARPSSNHPHGTQIAFCDTHVRFIEEDIDYRVYCQLMAPCDAEMQLPGRVPKDRIDEADPAFPDPLSRFTPLDEPICNSGRRLRWARTGDRSLDSTPGRPEDRGMEADLPRPPQYSLKWVLLQTALLGLCLALISQSWGSAPPWLVLVTLFATAGALAGGFFHRFVLGAFVGPVVAAIALPAAWCVAQIVEAVLP